MIDDTIPMYTPVRDYQTHHYEYQKAIQQVCESGAFINGPEIIELEKQLADYVGIKHCITVANGTDALLVALMALNVKPGDEVLTAAHTWISSSEVISVLGAKPVWVDIDPENFMIDLDQVADKITHKTVGIMPISLYGQMVDIEKCTALAKKHNLWIIEDGAQSFGSTRHGQISCSWGDIGCTSFFPTKPLGAYGDAGACFTSSDKLALKLRAIKSHGGIVRMKHDHIGLNARMDTLQAAILLVKFKHFAKCLEQRRAVAQYYCLHLKNVKGLTIPEPVSGMNSAWAQFSIMMTGNYRDQVEQMLKDRGVSCAVFYKKGLHEQECFQYLGPANLPQTEYVCQHILHIPLFAELTDEEMLKVVNVIKEVMEIVCAKDCLC